MDSEAIAELALLARWELLDEKTTPVQGGLTHRMFRVRTRQGDFAVKALSPLVMTYRGVRENFRQSERIASAAAEAGIPAVCALEIAGDVIHDVGGQTVVVYPWVGAISRRPDASSAAQIGRLAGRIHRLPLPIPQAAPKAEPPPQTDWSRLIAEAQEAGYPWAAGMEEALPDLLRWRSLAHGAEAELGERRVFGHRDLDPKNVLWSEAGAPWIVDWESAGPIAPAKEAVTVALDWSDQGPHGNAFRAALAGYRAETELTQADARLGLLTYFGWIDWLAHSLRRALGLTGEDDQARALAADEVPKTLRALQTFAANLDDLSRACAG